MDTSKRSFLKPKRSFQSKRSFQPKRSFQSKRPFRRRLLSIGSGDQIDYRNISLISRFISEQGKILSRRINKLTLKQQRLISIAIKQARILSLLPFLNKEKQFESAKSNTKTTGFRRVYRSKEKQFESAKSNTKTTGFRRVYRRTNK